MPEDFQNADAKRFMQIFMCPVNEEEQLGINWNSADVHLLIVDEVYFCFQITVSSNIQIFSIYDFSFDIILVSFAV